MSRRPKRTDPKLAIAYLRASTDKQDLTFDAQRAIIAEWTRREGVAVANTHVDQDVSGADTLEDRPHIGEAITELREKGAGVFVIAKRDRLARDVLVAMTIERVVESHGARVISADGVGNGTGPADEFMRTILDGAAAYERALIRQRTKAALAAKKARGERVGMVPYGFRLASNGKHHTKNGERTCASSCAGCLHLEIDPGEQQTIQTARELYAAGKTLRQVARALAEREIWNRRGRIFDLNQLSIFVRAVPACGRGHTHDVAGIGSYCTRAECAAGKGTYTPERRIDWRIPK